MHPILFAAAVALTPSLVRAQDWPRFRGPNGSGVSDAPTLPTRFGPEENVRWKVDVPFGASSPVLTDEAVIVTGSDAERLFVMAMDRESGEELWVSTIERARTQEVYPDNDSASPSPVTDGQNVYVFFPELGLVSFDPRGRERWRRPLGPFVSFYGMSSSPVLAGETVIVLCDQQQGSFLVGVDARSGEERWRTEREGLIECWTTPVLYPGDVPREVIVFGSYFVTSHSVETGEELWRMRGFGYTPVCSPVLHGDRLYVSVPDHAEAGVPDWKAGSRADANGDGLVSRTEASGPLLDHFGWMDTNKDDHIDEQEWTVAYDGMNSKDYGLVAIDLAAEGGPTELWRYKKSLPSIASPLLYEGVLYLVRDGGLVTLIDAESGELVVRERLPEAGGQCWPSPVAAGGKVFLTNNSGQVSVVAAGHEWKVLGTNDLGEDCIATPAIGREGLFVRTRSAVWSFGESGR